MEKITNLQSTVAKNQATAVLVPLSTAVSILTAMPAEATAKNTLQVTLRNQLTDIATRSMVEDTWNMGLKNMEQRMVIALVHRTLMMKKNPMKRRVPRNLTDMVSPVTQHMAVSRVLIQIHTRAKANIKSHMVLNTVGSIPKKRTKPTESTVNGNTMTNMQAHTQKAMAKVRR